MGDVEVMDLVGGPGPSSEARQLPLATLPLVPQLPLPSSSAEEQGIRNEMKSAEQESGVLEGELTISLTSETNSPKRLTPNLRLRPRNNSMALEEPVLSPMERDENDIEHEADETNGIDTTGGTITLSEDKELAVANALPKSEELGNRLEPPLTPVFPKKSNLKRPRRETPELNTSTPSSSAKRIRIVENLEIVKKKNCMELNGDSGPSETRPILRTDTSTLTEEQNCDEKLVWLHSGSSWIDQSVINVDFVRENLSPANKKFSVEIDMRFILSDTVTAVLGSKTSIAAVGPSDFHLWVAENSPYNNPNLKAVYKENFLKLANLDGILNFDLTSPKELMNGDNVSNGNGLYYVGELWHDSKGFREYILSKTSQNSKQFSTKICSWKINGPGVPLNVTSSKVGILFQNKSSGDLSDKEQFPYLPTEVVESFNGAKSQDLLDGEAINSFVRFVSCRTNGAMLHFLISDNPEISYAYESCREIRFQKHFYCQCLLALRCIREGGTFVCKIFDTFTLFTNGLLFLLHKCFKSITMHKPSASSSYTSERFIICKGKLENADSRYAVDFLLECLDMVVNDQKQMRIVKRRATKRLTVIRMEVQTLVPLKQILGHAEFFQYVRSTNIRLSMELAESIDRVCHYMEAGDEPQLRALVDASKKTNSAKLTLWNVPSAPLKQSLPTLTQELVLKCKKFLTDNHNLNDISFKEFKLENVCSVSDLCTSPLYESSVAFPIQATENNSVFKSTRGLFYGSGGTNILHFDGLRWQELKYLEFSLPGETLLLGEVTEDICTSGKISKFVRTFHLFDGIFISGVFIGSTPLANRQIILRRFLKSVNNPTCILNENCCVIPSVPISELSAFYDTTTDFSNIGYPCGIRSYNRCDSEKTLGLVGGFLLLRTTENSSPKDFFESYQHSAWIWRGLDGYSGRGLQKLPVQEHIDYIK